MLQCLVYIPDRITREIIQDLLAQEGRQIELAESDAELFRRAREGSHSLIFVEIGNEAGLAPEDFLRFSTALPNSSRIVMIGNQADLCHPAVTGIAHKKNFDFLLKSLPKELVHLRVRQTLSSSQAEGSLRSLLSAMPDLVMVLDQQGKYCDVFTTQNQFLFAPTPALSGKTIHEILPPKVARAVQAVIDRALESEKPVEWEYSLEIAERETWFRARIVRLEQQEVPKVLWVAREVTEQKIAEIKVNRLNEQFQNVCRATNDMVWEWDITSGAVHWNDNICKSLGHAPTEVGEHISWWKSLLHPDDRESTLQSLNEFLKSDREKWSGEYRFRRGDGSYAEILDRGFATREADGRPVRMAGAMIDITERKQMQSKLVTADRMASVGTLAAGVAHEVNNPLAYAASNFEFSLESVSALLSDKSCPQQTAATLDEVRASLQEAFIGLNRVKDIVRDLKVFSRSEETETQAVELTGLLDLAIKMAGNSIRHKARLVKEFSTDLPLIQAQSSKLSQVFLNLLINASQALPQREPGLNEIRVVARRKGGGAVIEIHDTGLGIPPETLKRIFDPFFTTKPVGEGTGLGLSICHTIVSSIGGEITVETELNRGTCFSVWLPECEKPIEAAAPKRAFISGVLPRKLGLPRLLVVDDEALLGNVIKRLLTKDFEVEATTSALDALSLIRAGSRYDAILCDLMMPEMTGMELHQKLASEIPEVATQMVFMTGGAFTKDARDFLLQNSAPCIEKPFNAEGLREAVLRIPRS